MTEEIHSDLPISLDEFLEEVLDDLGITKDRLAKKMNISVKKLNLIFRGNEQFTSDMALQLEKITGIPAHIWTGLDSEYHLSMIKL